MAPRKHSQSIDRAPIGRNITAAKQPSSRAGACDAARENLAWCAEHGVHAVVGTSGFSESELADWRNQLAVGSLALTAPIAAVLAWNSPALLPLLALAMLVPATRATVITYIVFLDGPSESPANASPPN